METFAAFSFVENRPFDDSSESMLMYYPTSNANSYKAFDNDETTVAGGAKVLAPTPIIVSASRSTDVPAFYSDWFIERLEAVFGFL